MSIELPRQPTGRSRRCYKCKLVFIVQRTAARARQCEPCRAAAKAAPVRVRPSEALCTGHTDDWTSRSLALVEAAYLRMAWGRDRTGNVE